MRSPGSAARGGASPAGFDAAKGACARAGRSASAVCSIAALTAKSKRSSSVASGGNSSAPGARGCAAASHRPPVRLTARLDVTRPAYIDSDGVSKFHTRPSATGARPSKERSAGLSESVIASSGGHGPSVSKRATLVVTQ